jgi:hypothetical protein
MSPRPTPPGLVIAPEVAAGSWLHESRFDWYREAYAYATTQTRAIPTLAATTPEALYFAFTAMLRAMGVPIPTEHAGPEGPDAPVSSDHP